MSFRHACVLVLVLAPVTLLAAACVEEPPVTTTPPEACDPGSYNSTDGNEPCTPAPPGFFVDTPGALQATPRALGTYQASVGQSSCVRAPIGFYVDTIAATAATACPALTTTAAVGSDSLGDCMPLVAPSLVFSNAQDVTLSNFGFLSGAGLQPGTTITMCADQFPCQLSGLTVGGGGTVLYTGVIFPALPCKTNIYFTTITAVGAPITSNTASYPPGTPGCP